MSERNKIGEGLAGGALGAYLTAKYGKRGLSRWMNTYGFGNVDSSYKGPGKMEQALDDLVSTTGKRRNVPLEMIKSMRAKGVPPEIVAMKRKLSIVREDLSLLKESFGKDGHPDIKKLEREEKRLSKNLKSRRMASAIKERSFGNRIGFSHSGKFIEGTYPQQDPSIQKALKSKGLNTKNPIPIYHITDADEISDLRKRSASDPRMNKVRDFLKRHQVSKARDFIATQKDMKIHKTGKGLYTVSHVPHKQSFGKLKPSQNYVLGGHTQRVEFGKIKGRKGLHKLRTSGFDVTTYVSQGETVKSAKGAQKIRALLGGRFGQNVGIHRPVVSTFNYTHKAPGGGRKKGKWNKKWKYTGIPQSNIETYSDKRGFKRASKQKNMMKRLLMKAVALASRGKLKL